MSRSSRTAPGDSAACGLRRVSGFCYLSPHGTTAQTRILPHPQDPAIRPGHPGRIVRADHRHPQIRQDQGRPAVPAGPAGAQARHAVFHPALDPHLPLLQQRLPDPGDPDQRNPRFHHLFRGQGREPAGQPPHLQLLRGRGGDAHQRGRPGRERRGPVRHHPAARAHHQRRQRQGSASHPGAAGHLHPGAQLQGNRAASTARPSP